MTKPLQSWWVGMVSLVFACSALVGQGATNYFQVEYAPSESPGGLRVGVNYTIWIPEGVKELRAVIVHQHGCGSGACDGGATAAYDLHWQALARKWNCALLGPSYHQSDKEDCTLWCNPQNGSEKAFLGALVDLGRQSGHPELARIPWCLWGHSGGGYWAGEMHLRYPERVIAVWQRSGAARFFQEKTPADIPASVFQVPVVCNPGVKEKDDRFAKIYDGMLELFRFYRSHSAPICFAPDPKTSHECGDSRYLAIPFFDACLEMRLPRKDKPLDPLRPVRMGEAWLAPLSGEHPVPASKYSGAPNEANWLPNEAIANKWLEYIRTGTVSDLTPPPRPFAARAVRSDKGVELTWDAHADFESGLTGFLIFRNGTELATVPAHPKGRFGRPLFQVMSYHDTPEKPVPPMTFLDVGAPAGHPRYEIFAVNSAGLKSRPTKCNIVEKP